MGYKDMYKVGDIVSTTDNINEAISRANLLEVIGYKNISNIFHLKVKSYRTGMITDYPAMYAERDLTNYGKKQVVELLWIRK